MWHAVLQSREPSLGSDAGDPPEDTCVVDMGSP
jgi:hypothetical protein